MLFQLTNLLLRVLTKNILLRNSQQKLDKHVANILTHQNNANKYVFLSLIRNKMNSCLFEDRIFTNSGFCKKKHETFAVKVKKLNPQINITKLLKKVFTHLQNTDM